MPVIPVFTAQSRLRRIFFRAIVASLVIVFLFLTFLFIFALVSRTTRAAVSTTEALDAYHYYWSPATSKEIAITIDDGPTGKETEQNMQVLLATHTPATFFFIGEHLLQHPEPARAVVQNGFEVGNHSFTHSFQTNSSQSRLALELHSTEVLIQSITGANPLYYRPPYLLDIGIDPAPNPYIPPDPANSWSLALGYLPVGIDIDTRDWVATSSAQIVATFKEEFKKGGHIVLFHDVKYTPQALAEIIPWVRAQGYTLVPLSALLTPPQAIALTYPLKLGDTDAKTAGEVSKLQWFLNKQDFLDPYALTGVFDENTYDALTLFQAKEGLVDPSAPDASRLGVADLGTRAAIAAVSQSMAKPPAPPPSTLSKATWAIERDYIYFLSYLRIVIVGLATMAIVFVAIRIMVFASLIIWGKHGPRPRNNLKSQDFRVSILIPAYNEAENIRSTMESAIKIFYEKKEIIIIDDGSTDATGEIAKQVIIDHPEADLTLLSVKNGGKARALTLGATRAKGDILIILDADAVMDREAVSLMVRHFADPEVGAVAGKVYTTTRSSILDFFQALEYAVGQNIDKRALSVLGSVGVVPGPAGAWRKDLVMAAGGFPLDTLVEDQDMTLTLLRMGKKIIYEPRALAYTETPHNITNFLKQRFRWVYGTMQCFWKHKRVVIERPFSPMSYIVMPNILVFGILLPITYPIVDTILVMSFFFGPAREVLVPIIFFTIIDTLYAVWGLWGEKKNKKLLWFVPLQRVMYRQLLYITVIRSLVHAIEGRGSRWNKFAKLGDTQRFYFTSLNNTPPQAPAPQPEVANTDIPAPNPSASL